MPGGNYNLQDPAEQEKIRRQPHEYVPSEGKHGTYRLRPYVHQEYPKMMAAFAKVKDEKTGELAPKYPKPDRRQFKGADGEIAYQLAVAEWDNFMQSSVVHSKAQESAWLKEHA